MQADVFDKDAPSYCKRNACMYVGNFGNAVGIVFLDVSAVDISADNIGKYGAGKDAGS
jgi:hypothetical protein